MFPRKRDGCQIIFLKSLVPIVTSNIYASPQTLDVWKKENSNHSFKVYFILLKMFLFEYIYIFIILFDFYAILFTLKNLFLKGNNKA